MTIDSIRSVEPLELDQFQQRRHDGLGNDRFEQQLRRTAETIEHVFGNQNFFDLTRAGVSAESVPNWIRENPEPTDEELNAFLFDQGLSVEQVVRFFSNRGMSFDDSLEMLVKEGFVGLDDSAMHQRIVYAYITKTNEANDQTQS